MIYGIEGIAFTPGKNNKFSLYSWEATSFWPYLANYWPKDIFVGLVSLHLR